MSVGKFSIPMLVVAFILYIIFHTAIGFVLKKQKEELEEKPGNVNLEQSVKLLSILFKWFPAFAIVVVLIMFYA